MVTLSSILRFAGIGGRFSLGHPMTWLVITLLCLGIGYAWLSTYASSAPRVDNSSVRKLTNFDSSTTRLIDEVPVEKEAEMQITQSDDEVRAEAYLDYEAIQQQILPLLDQADVHFEAEQYVLPPGSNAWEDYHAILALNPDEAIAISGLNKIKSKLLAGAEQAIDSGDIAAAEGWLVQLDVIEPGADAQVELREEIKALVAVETARKLEEQEAEALKEKIETTLSQAQAAADSEDRNINKEKDLYNRVLELDPGNQTAEDGLAGLSDLKLDDAEVALRAGDLDLARTELRQAANIFPANKRIGSLELALGASLKQQQAERDREKAKQEANQESTIAQVEKAVRPVAPPRAATAIEKQDPDQPLASGVIAQARQNKSVQKPSSSETRKALSAGIAAYYNGNYNNSFELLYPLAEEGVARAQFRIGIMYQFGRSVAKNTDLAEKWFTAALPVLLRRAQEGIAWAQTDLGTAYEFGISLQQDYDRAAYWYQLAADQGYAGAQTNLGVLYAQGDGVPYDRSKAIFWFRKAAKQGDRVARENLNILGASQ